VRRAGLRVFIGSLPVDYLNQGNVDRNLEPLPPVAPGGAAWGEEELATGASSQRSYSTRHATAGWGGVGRGGAGAASRCFIPSQPPGRSYVSRIQ